MACKDCFPNCVPVSDQCVKHTGESEEKLDICSGDNLAWVNENLIKHLLTALNGTGITVEDIDVEDYPSLEDLETPKLADLLKAILRNHEELKEEIEKLPQSESKIFDLKCLNISTASTRDEILQEVVKVLCAISTTISKTPTDYVRLTDLESLVRKIITTDQSQGEQQIPQHYHKFIPHVAMPYFGPISNFDSTGKGIVAAGWEKVYICNGLNGTVDMRGRTPVGAVRNVPGGAFDAAVDPNNPNNPNMNYALGDKFGANYHTLTTAEIPAHNHAVNDPGHTHGFTFGKEDATGNNHKDFMKFSQSAEVKQTQTSKTGITLSPVGGSQAHNNVQPSIATIFIMYIP